MCCVQRFLRINLHSCRRFAVVFGYAIFSSLNASMTICETINLAFSLSSSPGHKTTDAFSQLKLMLGDLHAFSSMFGFIIQ